MPPPGSPFHRFEGKLSRLRVVEVLFSLSTLDSLPYLKPSISVPVNLKIVEIIKLTTRPFVYCCLITLNNLLPFQKKESDIRRPSRICVLLYSFLPDLYMKYLPGIGACTSARKNGRIHTTRWAEMEVGRSSMASILRQLITHHESRVYPVHVCERYGLLIDPGLLVSTNNVPVTRLVWLIGLFIIGPHTTMYMLFPDSIAFWDHRLLLLENESFTILYMGTQGEMLRKTYFFY